MMIKSAETIAKNLFFNFNICAIAETPNSTKFNVCNCEQHELVLRRDSTDVLHTWSSPFAFTTVVRLGFISHMT